METPSAANPTGYDYEVIEVPAGCTKYVVGNPITLYPTTSPPPQYMYIGTGKCANTKCELIPQRAAS